MKNEKLLTMSLGVAVLVSGLLGVQPNRANAEAIMADDTITPYAYPTGINIKLPDDVVKNNNTIYGINYSLPVTLQFSGDRGAGYRWTFNAGDGSTLRSGTSQATSYSFNHSYYLGNRDYTTYTQRATVSGFSYAETSKVVRHSR